MRNLKKLLNLKRWLPVSDAARHLSILFAGNVTEADVLKLGLDRHLKLSVHFVNHAFGRPGRLVPILEAKRSKMPSLNGDETIEFFNGLQLNDDSVIEWENKIIILVRVWDLAMVGAESIHVEHRYQYLTGGPSVELFCLNGPIVCLGNGLYCEVQRRDLKHTGNAREQFYDPQNYYPAGALPDDSVLVVRTSALEELEYRLSEPEQRPEKPIERRERTSLLLIIAALAKIAKIDVTKPSAAPIAIETQTELMGARVASRTIENHLNRIPEALENRESK